MSNEDKGTVLQPILPVREGAPQGGRTERVMLAKVGGAEGCKTLVQNNVDGSTTTLRTRGGFPEFVTEGTIPEEKELVKRTFVFNLLTIPPTKKAKVANRGASPGDMKVAAKKIDVGEAGYWVSSLRTKPPQGKKVKWLDVVRLDYVPPDPPATVVKRIAQVNGGEQLGLVADDSITAFPDNERYTLPYMLIHAGEHVATIPDSTPLRSGLFIGTASTTKRGVLSITPTGTEAAYQASGLTTTDLAYCTLGEAGGIYTFLSCPISFGGGDGTVIITVNPYHAVIRATYDPPYLSLDAQPTRAARSTGQFHDTAPPAMTSVARNVYAPFSDAGPSSFIACHSASIGPWQLDPLSNELGYRYFQEITDGGAVNGSYRLRMPSTVETTLSGLRTGTKETYTGTDYALVATATQTYEGTGMSWSEWNNIALGPSPCQIVHSMSVNNTQGAIDVNDATCLVTLTSAAVGEISNIEIVIKKDYRRWEVLTPPGTIHVVGDPVLYEITGFGPAPPPPPDYGTDFPCRGELGFTLFAGSENVTTNDSAYWIHSNSFFKYTWDTFVTAHTKDYIFADKTNEVYLYLECLYSQTTLYSQTSAGIPSVVVTHDLTLKYVLEFEGEKTEWEVCTNKSDFDSPDASNGVPFLVPGSGLYPVAFEPPPIFAPLFMSQGACPFIAYTTKVEHAAGARPEIYLDGTFLAIQPFPGYVREPFKALRKFVPFQFYTVFQKLICYEEQAELQINRRRRYNSATWLGSLFPTASPMHLQMTNGAKAAVGSKLGGGFSGNPDIEISRI